MRHTDQEHRVDKQRRNTDTTIQMNKEKIATWLTFESTHNNRQRRETERERERVQRTKARNNNLRSRNRELHETETTMTTMNKCKTALAARGEKTQPDWSVLNIGRAKSFRKRLELGTLLWDLLWDPLL